MAMQTVCCRYLTGMMWLLSISLTGALHAQAIDPPSRVAQVSFEQGELALLPAGDSTWHSVGLNRPVTTGDQLNSQDRGRLELDLGGADLRLTGNSSLQLTELDGDNARFSLNRGSAELSVRSLAAGMSYEVDTPQLSLVLTHPGRVRVDISPDDGATVIRVNDGMPMVYGANQAQRQLYPGQRYRFQDNHLANADMSGILGGDDFDQWYLARDAALAGQSNQAYVSDEMVGADNLAEWGSWAVDDDDDDGAVWYPNTLPVGWAPYRFGYWAWIEPWGWTWIDDLPWGFAPYHYGRWVWREHRWGWLPGPRHARPVYAPALVAFVGGQQHPVGWFPLGPHDFYHPPYAVSRDYFSRLNLSNMGSANRLVRVSREAQAQAAFAQRPTQADSYAYRQLPGAFSAISAQAMAHGQPVASHLATLNTAQSSSLPLASAQHLVEPASGVRAVPAPDAARALLNLPQGSISGHGLSENYRAGPVSRAAVPVNSSRLPVVQPLHVAQSIQSLAPARYYRPPENTSSPAWREQREPPAMHAEPNPSYQHYNRIAEPGMAAHPGEPGRGASNMPSPAHEAEHAHPAPAAPAHGDNNH